MGVVVTTFRYLHDPLFLAALSAYALNRGLLQPLSASPFLHGYFDDLLLIPAALPVMLWLQRRHGWRLHDRAPTWNEMGMHLIVWSLICECIGPRWLHRGTADMWDVAAYAFGGAVACLWWNFSRRPGAACAS